MKRSKEFLPYLIKIAELGGLWTEIDISTKQFADEFSIEEGVIQQTASRKLEKLKDLDWITKRPSIRGQYIKITSKGKKELEYVLQILKEALDIPNDIEIEGELFTGRGEGSYYVKLGGYKQQFLKKLQFTSIYPGTLNLRLRRKQDIEWRRKLYDIRHQGYLIEGFRDEDRTFGNVFCFCSEVSSAHSNITVEGAILLIERTSWERDVLEIISPHYLRGTLRLNDGDNVSVQVLLNKDKKEG